MCHPNMSVCAHVMYGARQERRKTCSDLGHYCEEMQCLELITIVVIEIAKEPGYAN